MAKKRVTDLLVEVLADVGVQRIYGVSGDSLNGVKFVRVRVRSILSEVSLRKKQPPATA